MDNESKFITKRNKLTAYAFSCGYIEKYASANWQDETDVVLQRYAKDCYIVKGFIKGNHLFTVFKSMKAARKMLKDRGTYLLPVRK